MEYGIEKKEGYNAACDENERRAPAYYSEAEKDAWFAGYDEACEDFGYPAVEQTA